MGFFDRFRRQTPVTTYEFADRPVVDRPVVNDRVVEKRNDGSGWLWLLLLPLFLLLGLGAYTYFLNPTTSVLDTNQPNFLSRLFNRDGNPSSTNNNGGLQIGVGGSPEDVTPTPSATSTTMSDDSDTESAGSVQSAATRQIPGEAPSTGRGAK